MRKGIKIIHVHFLVSHKNYYFGSVRAVFKKFSEETIGCNESYLRRQLTEDGNKHLTKKVLVIRSSLIR